MKSKRKNKQKDILFIIISSFVVVVAWIAFNLYHIHATSTVSPNIQMQLTPIDPNFDQATMQQLKSRENINPVFEKQQTASQSAPTPTTIQTTPADTTQLTSSPSGTSQLSPTTTPINRQGQ